jgi:hypothetical protein
MEAVARIDIHDLYRQGFLQSGARGTLTWHWGEQEAGSIGFLTEGNTIILFYHFRSGEENWEAVEETRAWRCWG